MTHALSCKKRRAGFSMIEFMVFLPVVAMVGFWVSELMRKPVSVAHFMTTSQLNNDMSQAGDTMMHDIQGAIPSSVDLTIMPPAISSNTMTFSFLIPSYVANVAQAPIPVQYMFQATGTSGKGSLIRLVNNVTTTVVATNLDPPTQTYPLVQQDTVTLNMLTITLLYTPDGQPQTRVVRRTALKT